MKVYLIGALKNRAIMDLANDLRSAVGCEVFDDWLAPGPEADGFLREYELNREHSYAEALRGHAAQHVFHFDKHHLDTSDVAVLVLPAGKSGHLELGYMAGQGKRTYVLLEDQEPDRIDIMYNFADGVLANKDELIARLRKDQTQWIKRVSDETWSVSIPHGPPPLSHPGGNFY